MTALHQVSRGTGDTLGAVKRMQGRGKTHILHAIVTSTIPTLDAVHLLPETRARPPFLVRLERLEDGIEDTGKIGVVAVPKPGRGLRRPVPRLLHIEIEISACSVVTGLINELGFWGLAEAADQ